MKHRVFIGLLIAFLALVFGAGQVVADLPENPEGYVLPAYFLYGDIDHPEGGSVADHTVFVHKLEDDGTIAGTLSAQVDDVSGAFSLNLYELYYAYGVNVHDDLTTRQNFSNYYAGVYSNAGYGKTPIPLTDLAAAWSAADGFTNLGPIVLVAGEGQIEVGVGGLGGVVTNNFGNLIRNITVVVTGTDFNGITGIDGIWDSENNKMAETTPAVPAATPHPRPIHGRAGCFHELES